MPRSRPSTSATATRKRSPSDLRANPNVVLTTGCNRWDAGVDVVVEGVAVPVTDEETLSRTSATRRAPAARQ